MGPEPEAMEASLLQVYAPRDPLTEVFRGEITLRQFRVMVEGVPLTSETPVGRALGGPWDDSERLLRVIAQTLTGLETRFFNVHRAAEAEPITAIPEIPAPPDTWYQKQQKPGKKKRDKHRDRSDAGLLAVLAAQRESEEVRHVGNADLDGCPTGVSAIRASAGEGDDGRSEEGRQEIGGHVEQRV